MEIEANIEIETKTGEPPTEIQRRLAIYLLLVHALVKFFREDPDMTADIAVEAITKSIRVSWDEVE